VSFHHSLGRLEDVVGVSQKVSRVGGGTSWSWWAGVHLARPWLLEGAEPNDVFLWHFLWSTDYLQLQIWRCLWEIGECVRATTPHLRSLPPKPLLSMWIFLMMRMLTMKTPPTS